MYSNVSSAWGIRGPSLSSKSSQGGEVQQGNETALVTPQDTSFSFYSTTPPMAIPRSLAPPNDLVPITVTPNSYPSRQGLRSTSPPTSERPTVEDEIANMLEQLSMTRNMQGPRSYAEIVRNPRQTEESCELPGELPLGGLPVAAPRGVDFSGNFGFPVTIVRLLGDAAAAHVIAYEMADGKELGADVVSGQAAVSRGPCPGKTVDFLSKIQSVLQKSLAHNGLIRGLHESIKAIENNAAKMCVVAEDCDEPYYLNAKLLQSLCFDHNVTLYYVPSAKTLGEWAGLCKIDSQGRVCKVIACACVVVKDFGDDLK